jgi:aminoglycoside phosphotransferase (APT) family kinase protein
MSETDPTTERLLAAIRVAADQPRLHWENRPQRLTGGFWAEMWRIRLAGATGALGGELVARVMPEVKVAARETAVQAYLADSGYPTPKVRLAAGPGPDLDRAWMLMDVAPGRPLLADLSGPAAIARLPLIARDLPDRLAHHMTALHAIDVGALRSEEDEDEAMIFVGRLHDQTTQMGRVDLSAVAAWLEQHRPPGGRVVICHGDLHPFNILTDPTGDTVLDWSNARLTDPAYDIAFTRLLLSHPPLSAPRPLKPVIAAAGWALARRFTRTYAKTATTPVDTDQLAWFTNLHALRMLTEAAAWQANDELDQHPGHPFLSLRGSLVDHLRGETGITISAR